ncbi:MAG: hypothetical protein JO019_04160 [Candidatus Kaiserbacteria bacterium]|nr:hypothetical protein [Candidatus Kaiserbacteria bacterium]
MTIATALTLALSGNAAAATRCWSPMTIWRADDCSICRALEAYLKQQGISYATVDVGSIRFASRYNIPGTPYIRLPEGDFAGWTDEAQAAIIRDFCVY